MQRRTLVRPVAAVASVLFMLAALLGVGWVAPASALADWSPIDLGTLGGTRSNAVAVSGNIVVGWSDTASGAYHAFAYDLGAAEPTMVDLGTLGGTRSNAVAVSGNIVVGWSDTASGAYHAFAYDLGAAQPSMVDLGTLGGIDSEASAVSGNIVVGRAHTADGQFRAFAYDLGAAKPRMVDLGTLGGTASSGAFAVSGNIVVGRANTTDGTYRAFAYDLGAGPAGRAPVRPLPPAAMPSMVDLGTLGGAGSGAFAVSGNIVVGRSDTADSERAFAYDLGDGPGGRAPARPLPPAAMPSMVDLGTLGGIRSVASAVSGDIVVGRADTASGTYRAFAYDLGAAEPTMVDLGTLGGMRSVAAAVSGNIVVGRANTTDGTYRAFAYDLGAAEPTMVDLGTLGGIDSEAWAVSGNIVVGWANTTDGTYRAFAWRPSTATTPAVTIDSATRSTGLITVEFTASGTPLPTQFECDLGTRGSWIPCASGEAIRSAAKTVTVRGSTDGGWTWVVSDAETVQRVRR